MTPLPDTPGTAHHPLRAQLALALLPTFIVLVVYGMIFARAMHLPAVATALSFAFSAGRGGGLALFGLCLGLIVLLVLLQRVSLWLLRRLAAPGRKDNLR